MISQKQFDDIEEREYEEDLYDFRDFEEEDLLTNFSAYQLPLYEKAVKEYGDDTLYISNEAYNCHGHKMEGSYSLRTVSNNDRTSFWNLLDSLRPLFQKR